MAKIPKQHTMLAYSYIRWSSEGQSLGDSQRRQTALADAWAARNNIPLDTATYQDHGISAFKGANIVEGKLGAFLQAIDEGRIKTPCYLLVEALDRITRTEITEATHLFTSIIRKGVTIVTLQNDQEFSKASINKDRGISLIIAISMLVQGHEDSAKRAIRVREAFDENRAKGIKKLTKIPTWLIPNPDRKTFQIDHDLARLINRIFALAISGRGQRDVAQLLNKEKIPTLHIARKLRDKIPMEKKDAYRVWDQGAVGNVLGNHAVYGRKDLTDEDDYWPPIMSKDKFMTAQDAVRGRKWKGANRDGIPNLFAGLAFCAICGSRVRLLPTGNGYYYLKCTRAADEKTCRAKMFPYGPCETAFVYTISRKAGLDISGEYLVERATRAPALRGEIDALRDRQKNLLKLASLAVGVEAVADELNALQKRILELENQLQQLDKNPLSRNEINRHRDLFDRYLKLTDEELRKSDWMPNEHTSDEAVADMRRKMKVAMARLFKRIEFGVGKEGWEPIILITLADDSRAIVNVQQFLTGRSLKRQKTKKVPRRKAA